MVSSDALVVVRARLVIAGSPGAVDSCIFETYKYEICSECIPAFLSYLFDCRWVSCLPETIYRNTHSSLPPENKVWCKVIFSQAPVCPWEGAWQTPPGQTPPGQTLPLGRHPLGRNPLRQAPRETATAADGTHLTGMHSC